jgi:hypothetical protein
MRVWAGGAGASDEEDHTRPAIASLALRPYSSPLEPCLMKAGALHARIHDEVFEESPRQSIAAWPRHPKSSEKSLVLYRGFLVRLCRCLSQRRGLHLESRHLGLMRLEDEAFSLRCAVDAASLGASRTKVRRHWASTRNATSPYYGDGQGGFDTCRYLAALRRGREISACQAGFVT